MAFFEAALWDKLNQEVTRHGNKKRLFRLNHAPDITLVRERDPNTLAGLSKTKQEEERKKPFVFKEADTDGDWYWIDDTEVCAVRIAEHYLKSEKLKNLGQAVNKIRDLRNDVAHDEPTPDLMMDARTRMRTAALWSEDCTFLSQPLVQNVLNDLGEREPSKLLENLLAEVRHRIG